MADTGAARMQRLNPMFGFSGFRQCPVSHEDVEYSKNTASHAQPTIHVQLESFQDTEVKNCSAALVDPC